MDEKYWDTVGTAYDEEIFSVLANDDGGVIRAAVEQFANRGAVAGDFGCGVGKFLPMLAEEFRYVYAFDISATCLEQAQEKCAELENVSIAQCDLARPRLRLEEVDFALSVNVLIMPERQVRRGILRTIERHVREGGHFVLVVPSLESALYSDFRLVQWNLRSGLDYDEAVWELGEGANKNSTWREGLVAINGVATKHYLREELEAIFARSRFELLNFEKVEYSWKTEFEKPPGWMGEPYPWDWMVVLKKV